MRYIIIIFYVFSLIYINQLEAKAQGNTLSSGGEESGSGGSISFSIGQVFYNTYSGLTSSSCEGLQQAIEIQKTTKSNEITELDLSIIVYPNPTTDNIQLEVLSKEIKKARFQLIDINGTVIKSEEIHSMNVKINMENLQPSIYFLEIFNENQVSIIYKVIKN